MKLVWTEPARDDLCEIFTFIAQENPSAARRLLRLIREKATVRMENPNIARIGRVDGTREFVMSGTHYILPYRINGQQIQILAVIHGARQ
jgi:addiction module RelE/StbE family toxin